jgi:hypothetical protein
MTVRVDTTQYVSSKTVIGVSGLGVLGSTIASTGQHGASVIYNDLVLPADNNKEVRILITQNVQFGSLFVFEDGSFIYSGTKNDSFKYQLYVDGVATGPEVMVNFTTNGVVGIETKIHDPVTGDWVTTSTKVWNGSTWNVTVFKTWNGSAWV